MYAGFSIHCGMDYALQSPHQLASHLRALRKARGLSQQQLGELLGLSQSRVARIESEPGSVSVDQFLSLLAALHATLLLRTAEPAPRSRRGAASDDDAW
jgi:HTH-type transcriptional regulator/antitoxin HipB